MGIHTDLPSVTSRLKLVSSQAEKCKSLKKWDKLFSTTMQVHCIHQFTTVSVLCPLKKQRFLRLSEP